MAQLFRCRRLTIHFKMPAEQLPLTLASAAIVTILGKTVRKIERTPNSEKNQKILNLKIQTFFNYHLFKKFISKLQFTRFQFLLHGIPSF